MQRSKPIHVSACIGISLNFTFERLSKEFAIAPHGCINEIIIDLPDLFLYDLKLIDNAAHKKYTGTSNVLILENLRTLANKGKKVIIRFPLIPGITDTDTNIRGIRDFMDELPGINEINILPFHRIAGAKYEKLKLENKMRGVKTYSPEQVNQIEKFFINAGFFTRIGG